MAIKNHQVLSLHLQWQCCAYTKPGEAVLLQQPVYYPFSEVIADNERVIVNSPLKLIDGHYEIDFDDFEQKIRDNHVKLFLLCSPHNPVGRVWKKLELEKIGEICIRLWSDCNKR